jgi:SAM-dependent methyltransferase
VLKDKDVSFNDYSHYYDLLYQDKNYQGEAKYVVDVLNEYGISKGSVLELGSGTGRHGCLIGDSGFDVHGIELSKSMVDLAQTNDNFSCEQGDVRALNLDQRFDSVLALFHVVSYQTSSLDIQQLFEGVVRHLTPGGLFLFDFWYTPGVYTLKPGTKVKRVHNEKLEVTRIAEAIQHHNTNTVDVNYQLIARHLDSGVVKEVNETHTLRHFSLPEIDQLADQFGFTRVLAEEFVSKAEPSSESWAICVGLRLNQE